MSLAILNVGAGDTKLSFDPAKPAELERAKAVVQDMLKRGFAILVQVGEKDGRPLYQRAQEFDPATCEYIIVGVPEVDDVAPAETKPKQRRTRRLAASTTPAVAVARSAGG